MQGAKDQDAAKCNLTTTSVKSSACGSPSSSHPYMQERRYSSAFERRSTFESTAFKRGSVDGNQNKQKQAEESLRKVMYLSFWGPN